MTNDELWNAYFQMAERKQKAKLITGKMTTSIYQEYKEAAELITTMTEEFNCGTYFLVAKLTHGFKW